MKHIDYAYTRGMDDAEVDELLRETDSGVLAQCHDGEVHAIPLVHYYDGDELYFRFGTTDDSTKRIFVEPAETVCYTLYDTYPTDDPRELDSWSIVITGRLAEVPDDEYERFDTAEINDRFSPIRIFGEAIADVEITIVELEPERVTGRITPDSDFDE
ncbi:pyridoxamine 5'-phosphate oxidase family protein [Halorubrum sp. DTA98]|uniref:pyridoxamine 5'-phosphate oxidase family protein n=1 Tax=Halorubrum sp. DTA98 TaxID=3402163 RepID=UPI003AAC27E2